MLLSNEQEQALRTPLGRVSALLWQMKEGWLERLHTEFTYRAFWERQDLRHTWQVMPGAAALGDRLQRDLEGVANEWFGIAPCPDYGFYTTVYVHHNSQNCTPVRWILPYVNCTLIKNEKIKQLGNDWPLFKAALHRICLNSILTCYPAPISNCSVDQKGTLLLFRECRWAVCYLEPRKWQK